MTTLTLVFLLSLLTAIVLVLVSRNFGVIMRAAAASVTFVTMLLATGVRMNLEWVYEFDRKEHLC